MRFMAIITVNNPSMSSVDWIEHHTKMKKYTDAFTSLMVHECIDHTPVVAAAQKIVKAYVPANA